LFVERQLELRWPGALHGAEAVKGGTERVGLAVKRPGRPRLQRVGDRPRVDRSFCASGPRGEPREEEKHEAQTRKERARRSIPTNKLDHETPRMARILSKRA